MSDFRKTAKQALTFPLSEAAKLDLGALQNYTAGILSSIGRKSAFAAPIQETQEIMAAGKGMGQVETMGYVAANKCTMSPAP